MTKQGWTAVVSTALFVMLIIAISLIPVPFARWSPGTAIDLLGSNGDNSVLQISGANSYPATGELLLPTVSVTKADSEMTLPQAFLAYVMPDETVLPREKVYPAGLPADQQQGNENKLMTDSQRDAAVAALMAAGIPVQPLPQVTQVSSSGPSYGKVEVGDLISTVNGSVVERRSEVRAILNQEQPGSVIRLGLLRANQQLEVFVVAVASQDDPSVAQIGVELENSYQHSVDVQLNITPGVVGSSGGLPFALAIYDDLTSGALIDGRVVAATGTITATGDVGSIGALRQKLRGAEHAGAQIMLVPEGNCVDIEGVDTSVTVVKVTKLTDAITSLELLKNPSTADQVPRC